MIYPETDNLCYICYVDGGEDFLRCAKCKVPVHRECANLFNLEKGGTQKKLKLETSLYSQIRNYPQINNSQYKSWYNAWICEQCLAEIHTRMSCDFCQLRDGLLVKVKFKQKEKKPKHTNSKESTEPKWVHLNCILKLYGIKPHKDPSDRCYVLDKDETADAPDCKQCGYLYKMDVKCRTCHKYYAHNLCLDNDEFIPKMCNGCSKHDDIQEILNSNESGIYMQKFLKDLVDSDKYNDFCLARETKVKLETEINKQRTRKKEEIVKQPSEEKEEYRSIDHFMKLNDKNELIYTFPAATKEMFFQKMASLSAPAETVNGNNNFFGVQTNNVGPYDQISSQLNGENAMNEDDSMINKEDSSFIGTTMAPQQRDDNLNLFDPNGIFSIEEPENGLYEKALSRIEALDPGKGIDKDFISIKKNKKRVFKIIRERFTKLKKRGLDTFVEEVADWRYISSVQILKELKKIYLYSIDGKEEAEKIRLTKKWYELMDDLLEKGNSSCLKIYDEKMTKEILKKFNLYAKCKVKCDNWPLIPKSYRKYEATEDYILSVETDTFKQEVENTIKSKKNHTCSFNCTCCSLQNLGPYNVEKQTWETTCPGRVGLMECNEDCGCDLSLCKNKAISSHQRKRIGHDLEERYCWGIDYSTYNNILIVLPESPDIDRNNFIEKKLLKATHLSETPWDMISVCKKIIEQSRENNKYYTKTDRKLAKLLIRAIKFVNTFDKSAFRLHTKGYGVVCVREGGIPANDLISEYFGEIYTPWRWFEKQDLVKKYCNEKKMKDELPDFYNIMLEKHKDDPDGYDILIVDPINKGTYASRFSHSCDPNSGTVTTIANGKYGVAMYSLRDISYGEELTFDYFSVTENEKEYQQAICLCGSNLCRIHYLSLITSKNQASYLEKNVSFIELNYLICFACLDPLTEEDKELLEHYSIRGSMLHSCPSWLVKWIALILRLIAEENKQYMNFVWNKKKEEYETHHKALIQDNPGAMEEFKKHLKLEMLGLESDRIQNLTITVNKIKHVLELIKEKYIKGAALLRSQTRSTLGEQDSTAFSAQVASQNMSIESGLANIRNNTPRASVGQIANPEESKCRLPDEFFELDFPNRESTQRLLKEYNELTEGHLSQQNSVEKAMDLEKSQSDNLSQGIFDENDSRDSDDDEQNLELNQSTDKAQRSALKKKQPFKIQRTNLEDINSAKKSKNINLKESRNFLNKKMLKSIENITGTNFVVEPPLRKVEVSQICKALWDLNKYKEVQEITLADQSLYNFYKIAKSDCQKFDGIVNEVVNIIRTMSVQTDVDQDIAEIVQKASKTIAELKSDKEAQFFVIRRLFLQLSNLIRSLPKSNLVDWQGISDILYFYSLTFTYITNTISSSVSSEKEVNVRKCDIPNFAKYFEENELTIEDEAHILKSEVRGYGSSYIWAQMTIWWKQTVEKPEATLTQEKRGTLTYPSITPSFIELHADGTKEFEYPYRTRENWLKKMIESPYLPWPNLKSTVKKNSPNTWHYKNELKMHGSFLFDCLILKDKDPHLAEKVVKSIDKLDKDRKKLFEEMNSYYFETINYKLPSDI